MSFNICTCGNSENPHYFRHIFKRMTTIEKKDDVYIVNALDFPEKKDESFCTKPQCGKGKPLHDAGLYDHPFQPASNEPYREIRFGFPEDTLCTAEIIKDRESKKKVPCLDNAEKHEKMEVKHPMKIKLRILNKTDRDKVNVFIQNHEKTKIEVEYI